MLTLKLISTLSLFSSVTIGWSLIARRMTAAYLRGQMIYERIRADEEFAERAFPLLKRLGQPALVFLPLIDRLEASDRFGTRKILLELNRLLFRAGIRSTLSQMQLLSLIFASGALGAVGAAFLALLFGLGASGILILAMPVGALTGAYFPIFTVKNLAATRVSLIEKRLPFAIEFLVLTMEANASFLAAVEEYCRQLVEDPLAQELRMLLREIDHGVRLQDALSELNRRIESDPLSAFVLAVVTGIETGQPMKEVLKTQADVVRRERYNNAEVIAKTASVRALFPVFIVMIAVFILLLGPMAIKIARGSLF
ncbi:MAG TPA: type II secretion system F family protein [Blastocatellia bacterium]|jgi:Flp pilus assembly protein TadB|nr:type II secretion system F family protein [Blastocatellia bacterium]